MVNNNQIIPPSKDNSMLTAICEFVLYEIDFVNLPQTTKHELQSLIIQVIRKDYDNLTFINDSLHTIVTFAFIFASYGMWDILIEVMLSGINLKYEVNQYDLPCCRRIYRKLTKMIDKMM
jgi:hypothetical protein